MRRNHSTKELDQMQRVKRENDKLKKQISSLRKQLARIDLDRFQNLRETIEQHYKEDQAQEGLDILGKIKEEWRCHECNMGFLEIFIFNKIGQTHYYRICSNTDTCKHRTKPQIYDPNKVKGIIRKPSE